MDTRLLSSDHWLIFETEKDPWQHKRRLPCDTWLKLGTWHYTNLRLSYRDYGQQARNDVSWIARYVEPLMKDNSSDLTQEAQ